MQIDSRFKSFTINDIRILEQANKKKNQTTWDIIQKLDIPQATVYRAVRIMKEQGILSQKTVKDSPVIPHFKIDFKIQKI